MLENSRLQVVLRSVVMIVYIIDVTPSGVLHSASKRKREKRREGGRERSTTQWRKGKAAPLEEG